MLIVKKKKSSQTKFIFSVVIVHFILTVFYILIDKEKPYPIQDGSFQGCSRMWGKKVLPPYNPSHILQSWNLAHLYLS